MLRNSKVLSGIAKVTGDLADLLSKLCITQKSWVGGLLDLFIDTAKEK